MDPVERAPRRPADARFQLSGARLLEPLRGDDHPGDPGRIDLNRAIRAGRRRVRVRRLTTAAAAVAATLAVIIPTTVLANLPHPAPPAVQAPEPGFEVLSRAFTVGSAGGFTPDRYETGRLRQRITLRSADPARHVTGVITMYAAGRHPTLPTSQPAPPVAGRQAYWLPEGTSLAWEWAPDAWGTVTLSGVSERVLAHRVAQSVLPQPGPPVTVPFTVAQDALDGRYRVVGARSTYPGKTSQTSLLYDTQDPVDGEPVVEVGVRRPRPSADTTVGGVPAVVTGAEVVLLPPGREDAVFAKAQQERTMRALVQALQFNS
ncbi:hypothetical protein ABZ897_47070 [Nonomuraea sp. NPDC046802]|uniref:hypothetical protein n=1 Tax=Nonomuraea sp. NPDC046802 TaxID=3154919 RepID=UPI0033D4AD11